MVGKRLAGIDGLRFISISLVILHHLFTFKQYYNLSNIHFPLTGIMGLYGIHFFFVGSGFLITYLLLQEISIKRQIDLGGFIVRRVLRIWPAYLLLVGTTLLLYRFPFFDIPGITADYLNGPNNQSNALYLGMLPHLAPFANSTAPFLHPTYTIGIEEQFYLLWGLLFYFQPKYARTVLWTIALSGPVCNWLHHYLYAYHQMHPQANKVLVIIKQAVFYFQYSKFSTFAIGSLFAYAFYFKSSWVNWLIYKPAQLGFYLLLIFSCGLELKLPYMQYEFMAIVMAVLLLIAIAEKDSIINFNVKLLTALGRVSYGIYLFHIFAIVIAIRLLQGLEIVTSETTSLTILLVITTILLATCFGVISYFFFERYFLRVKKRFMRVKPIKAFVENV